MRTDPDCSAGLCVVYSDDAIVVLDKPPGLLSVPGRGADKQDCLSARVQARFSGALVVHRLDMATSGLIVMATNAMAHRVLSRSFAEREVIKQYEAVVHGELVQEIDTWRTIDLPILVDWPNRPLRIIDREHGKPSTTRLRATGYDEVLDASHVLLEPLTGRTHQLRVHMRAIGHPILGDALYAPAHVMVKAERLMLHAKYLAFKHPVSGITMHFNAQSLKCTREPHT